MASCDVPEAAGTEFGPEAGIARGAGGATVRRVEQRTTLGQRADVVEGGGRASAHLEADLAPVSGVSEHAFAQFLIRHAGAPVLRPMPCHQPH